MSTHDPPHYYYYYLSPLNKRCDKRCKLVCEFLSLSTVWKTICPWQSPFQQNLIRRCVCVKWRGVKYPTKLRRLLLPKIPFYLLPYPYIIPVFFLSTFHVLYHFYLLHRPNLNHQSEHTFPFPVYAFASLFCSIYSTDKVDSRISSHANVDPCSCTHPVALLFLSTPPNLSLSTFYSHIIFPIWALTSPYITIPYYRLRVI